LSANPFDLKQTIKGKFRKQNLKKKMIKTVMKSGSDIFYGGSLEKSTFNPEL